MAITLSVLIATMPSRIDSFAKLLNRIDSQSPMNGSVEILWDDSMEYNVGTKRNKLLDRCFGEYVVFIDDDDEISDDYIGKILIATKNKPDCIGISGYMTTNGTKRREWHISKDYGKWYRKGLTYYRTPNHISPVKREIAIKVGFPETSYGEDYAYSMGILPFLKTESIVEGELYYYKFKNK